MRPQLEIIQYWIEIEEGPSGQPSLLGPFPSAHLARMSGADLDGARYRLFRNVYIFSHAETVEDTRGED